MSDEASSSSAAAAAGAAGPAAGAAAEASAAAAAASSAGGHVGDHVHDERQQEMVSAATDIAERRKRNAHMFNRKRSELLDHLLRELDMNVYAQLSIIYYLDCSFVSFIIRALVQLVFLTPKPAAFPERSADRPFIGGLLGTNILCLLLHTIFAAPSAGEATRGYLYGGVVMDFIGQKGPTSKIALVSMDLLVAFLQIWQLSVHLQRQKLKGMAAVSVTTSSGRGYTATPVSQDLEHEERGLHRSDVEMQTLNPEGAVAAAGAGGESPERDSALAEPSPRTDARIFDAFHSGQIVLADLDLVQTVKNQFRAYHHQTAQTQPAQSSHDLRANIAGQLLRWRFGITISRPATRMG